MLSDIVRALAYKICRLLPVKKNKIIFISHLGKNYSCNPKYICEYILKHFPYSYDLIYLYDPTNISDKQFSKGIKTVSIYSWRYIYEISTCGFFVSNTRIPVWFNFKPRKGQCYLQTWHSSLRLKKIEKDANLGEEYEKWASIDSEKTSLIVSGCKFSSDIFKNAFWYKGPLLEVGTPRIDYLLNLKDNDIIEIKRKALLEVSFRYLIYAPTFRKNGDISAYNIDYISLAEVLKEKFGGDWKILFRLHPNLKDVVDVKSLPSCCVDMSGYSDIQELIAISDIMITDYSSCMFDMAFMKKLCILYASDLEQYMRDERDLYFDIKSLPFPLAQNNAELSKIVSFYDDVHYQEDLERFMKSIGSYETGNACKKILDYIEKI